MEHDTFLRQSGTLFVAFVKEGIKFLEKVLNGAIFIIYF